MSDSSRARLLEVVRLLKQALPTCKLEYIAGGSPIPQRAAISYLRKVGNVTVVARDRNQCPQRSILVFGDLL